MGQCKYIYKGMEKHMEQQIGKAKWTLLKQVRVGPRPMIKEISARVKLHKALERRNTKKIFEQYSTQKWTKLNPFTYFMMYKFPIHYNVWRHQGQEDASKRTFIANYGHIWGMIRPEEQSMIRYEATLFMTHFYPPTRYS